MKKFYNRLEDLLNEEIKYPNENYVSAYTIIDTYLKGYKNILQSLEKYDITELLNKRLNDDLHGYLSYSEDKSIIADIYNNKDAKILSLKYTCRKHIDPKLDYVITNVEDYKEGDIELFNNILSDEIKNYSDKYRKFDVDYDGTHKGMLSVNSIFFLYFVDSEIIIFPSKFNYMDVTINTDDTLSIDYKNMDLSVQTTLTGNEEKLLKNVYFNIEDAPDFLQEDLRAKRQEELSNMDFIVPENHNPLKRVRNWLKK